VNLTPFLPPEEMHSIWEAIANHGANSWDLDWPARAQGVPWMAGGNKGTLRVANQMQACLDLYREQCQLLKGEVATACGQLTSPGDLSPATGISHLLLRPLTEKAVQALTELQAQAQRHRPFNHGMEPQIVTSCRKSLAAVTAAVAMQFDALISIALDRAVKNEYDKAESIRKDAEKATREIRDSKFRNISVVLQALTFAGATVAGIFSLISGYVSAGTFVALGLGLLGAIMTAVYHFLPRHD
jgi:hypothetical protein